MDIHCVYVGMSLNINCFTTVRSKVHFKKFFFKNSIISFLCTNLSHDKIQSTGTACVSFHTDFHTKDKHVIKSKGVASQLPDLTFYYIIDLNGECISIKSFIWRHSSLIFLYFPRVKKLL